MTTRTRKAVIGIVAILVTCGIGLGVYIYFYVHKPWHEFRMERQAVAEIFARMESEPPAGVSTRDWDQFLITVHIAYGNVTGSPFYQRDSFDTLAGMRRFRRDFDRHLAATDTVDVDTLRWIFYRLAEFGPRGKAYIEKLTPLFEDHAASIERKLLKTAVEKADQHTLNQPLNQEVIMSEDSSNDPVSDNAGSPGNGLPDDGLEKELQSELPESQSRSVSTVPDAESIISGEIVDDLVASSISLPPEPNPESSSDQLVSSRSTDQFSITEPTRSAVNDSVGRVRRQPPVNRDRVVPRINGVGDRIAEVRENALMQRQQRVAKMQKLIDERWQSRRLGPPELENARPETSKSGPAEQ
ncbi:MAG: hypothetical protein ACI8P0_003290 [Planctomycetaceae bacterium]|jgi:hypothetical protein